MFTKITLPTPFQTCKMYQAQAHVARATISMGIIHALTVEANFEGLLKKTEEGNDIVYDSI